MRRKYFTPFLMKQLFLLLVLASGVFAQGYDEPLTTQGLDRYSLNSAASRAVGGTTLIIQNQGSLMFSNPASMQSVMQPQVMIGGFHQSTSSEQVQQYAPLKYYSNYSLLMEGLTGYIDDPDTSRTGSNPGDTIQRPFDNIGPNWSHSKNSGVRGDVFIAIPFSFNEMNFAVGLGVVDYADLNHHYENHNVLSPSIGGERPVPIARPASDSFPFVTNWSSYQRSREGFIRGYGLALSGAISKKISFGINGIILTGSSDDYEKSVGRGRLTFYRDWFRLDSVYQYSTKTGTSDYSGVEMTLGAIYRGEYLSLGVSVKPPLTITRKYSSQLQVDSTGFSGGTLINGEDKMQLPWRGSLAVSVLLRENLTIGLDYELHSYASAIYTNPAGIESNPWLSSSTLHLGVEYMPEDWLVFRAGARQQSQIFEEVGNPISGDPVSYSIYSGGCGIKVSGVKVNVTYEYGMMKYRDLYQSNINFNKESYHTVVADFVYELPWFTIQ